MGGRLTRVSVSESYKSREGFTLIELVVVVIVVAILAASAIPIYYWAMAKAYSSEVRALLGAIRAVQQTYFAEHHTWKPLYTPYASDDALEQDIGLKAHHNKWWHAETLIWILSDDLWSGVASGSGPWILAIGARGTPTAIQGIQIAIGLDNGEFLVSYDAGVSWKAE